MNYNITTHDYKWEFGSLWVYNSTRTDAYLSINGAQDVLHKGVKNRGGDIRMWSTIDGGATWFENKTIMKLDEHGLPLNYVSRVAYSDKPAVIFYEEHRWHEPSNGTRFDSTTFVPQQTDGLDEKLFVYYDDNFLGRNYSVYQYNAGKAGNVSCSESSCALSSTDDSAWSYKVDSIFRKMEIESTQPINITGSITVSTWLYLTDDEMNQTMIGKWSGGDGGRSYKLWLEDNKPAFSISDDGDTIYTISGSTDITLDEWHHVRVHSMVQF